MKLNATVHRYIFRELLSPFTLNLLFFTLVFLLTEILEITDMIVNYKIGLVTVLRFLSYSMPFFLLFIIPMSVMMAVLLTFLKLSSDNEIIALNACGVSLYQLMPPVVAFCVCGCLVTGVMAIEGVPWGRLAMKYLTIEVARSHIDIGLKERTFNTSFKGVVMYVNRIDPRNKELIDVFIQDERTADTAITVVAPRGKMAADPENLKFQLRLFDGTINQVSLERRTANTIRFDVYDISLDMEKALTGMKRQPKDGDEMRLSELRQNIRAAEAAGNKDRRYYDHLIEYHKKFSIPFACVSLGILAVPLGIQSKRARRSYGLALGIVLFLSYYLMLSAGIAFGETGRYPPAIGLWVPNIVTGLIGLYLLARTVRGKTILIDRIVRARWFRK